MKEYVTAKSFNLHYGKCLRNYDASQSKQSASSSPRQSSNAVKLDVCSVRQAGFSRLGTYKCHLSCHEKKGGKTIKSVIRSVGGNSKELNSATCAGITQPNLSKLPRIPRLSERNRHHSEHTFTKPPDAEPLADKEEWLPLNKQPKAVSGKDLEEPVVRLTLPVNNDEVIINNEMPMFVIRDVRHVERVEVLADSTGGFSMPELKPHEMYPETSDLNDDHLKQQLLEEMRVTDEENEEGEESRQARKVSSSREIVSSREEENVTVVEEQRADRPVNGSQAETDRVQASVGKALAETTPEKVSTSTNESVVVSEDEDVVIVNESKSNQLERVQVAGKKTSTVTTINVQLRTTSTISLLDRKPFVCTICCRKFHTENTMRLHYNIHNRKSHHWLHKRVNPPQKCNTHKKGDPRCCSQRRSSPESVSCRSKKTHLFECLFCDFSSVDQNALIKHKLHFHRNNFACKLCKRTFRTRFTRLLHMETHKSVAE